MEGVAPVERASSGIGSRALVVYGFTAKDYFTEVVGGVDEGIWTLC